MLYQLSYLPDEPVDHRAALRRAQEAVDPGADGPYPVRVADAPRRTPLFDWHQGHGARLVPFGGYAMPVWYGSALEEHRIVRSAAGLFDVAHMGCFDVSGPKAAAFLDAVTTNHISRLEPGRSQYGFFLGVEGLPIDDLITYRTGPERFLLVVNAANETKDWEWLNAVNGRRTPLDGEVPGPVALRDLKLPEHGADRRVDLALQGRAALPVLAALSGRSDWETLPRFAHRDASLGGVGAIVSRTGYTGEPVGFELLVHPDRLVELWEKILEAGAPHGVKPVGLAARDSTRTEAGFPLYGHELAGPHALIPHAAGYASFVKADKPFFIGRAAVLERERAMTRVVARFEVTDPGARAVRGDDAVVDAGGTPVGTVTSSVPLEGRQVGLALVDRALTKVGVELAVRRKPGAAPIPARVVKRFAALT